MPTHHHTGRPWLRRRLAVLERDHYMCLMPICKAAGWLTNPPRGQEHIAAQARQWAATQPTPRAIWHNAPRTGNRLHPLSPSVDMITPKSRGGSDTDITNLRAAHLLCNVSRGSGGQDQGHRYTTAPPRLTHPTPAPPPPIHTKPVTANLPS